MRRLLLFRHAKAERALPGSPDRERALTGRGRQDAEAIGAYMAGHALAPDHVLVSPALRTQQTWQCAAPAFKPAPRAGTDDRLYDATAQDILAAVKDAPSRHQSLLVIGHNPGLHELAQTLTGSGERETRERLAEKLPTSGLVVIEFAADDWDGLRPRSGRLERFVTPKSLSGD